MSLSFPADGSSRPADSHLHLKKIRILCACSVSTGVGPASVMVGNLVAGKRIAQASGRDLGQIEDNDLVKKVNQYLPTTGEWERTYPAAEGKADLPLKEEARI